MRRNPTKGNNNIEGNETKEKAMRNVGETLIGIGIAAIPWGCLIIDIVKGMF